MKTKMIVIASLLIFGGCLGDSSVESFGLPPEAGVDASADTGGQDATATNDGAGDTGADATVAALTPDAPKAMASDVGTKTDTRSKLDDGLCWYKHECPTGKFRCGNDDGTPVSDSQCLTKRNLCFCCAAAIPAFHCGE